ncbi:MAG TPA: hypothetical protein VF525_19900 [Pyrinomonadaceae bacterium]|jgi:hypothetical protein
MAWHLSVRNDYHEGVKALNRIINASEGPVTIDQWLGNGVIVIHGLGAINFTDIGQDHAGGHSKATWGVLISYQGEEVVFRYEGEGQIRVDLNKYGQATLSGNGEFSKVPLPSFIIKKSGGQHDNVISGN